MFFCPWKPSKVPHDWPKIFFQLAILWFNFFCPWKHEKTTSKDPHDWPKIFFQYCQLALLQPKSNILFHKNGSLHNFYIMTLLTIWVRQFLWNSIWDFDWIRAGWQYWEKNLGQLWATFEGVFSCFQVQKKTWNLFKKYILQLKTYIIYHLCVYRYIFLFYFLIKMAPCTTSI